VASCAGVDLRMGGYVMRFIYSLGLDDKGKRKKLEGNFRPPENVL
jgi:hypothetical protein